MKVLIITPNIPEYRFEIYQALAFEVDLTILHNGKKILKPETNFKQITLPLKQFGPFTYIGFKLFDICNNYEVVISEANIRHIDRSLLILNPFRKYKWVAWGIGVSASYNKNYDSDNSYEWFRYFIFRRADANIFYSDYPISKYL